MNQTTRLHLQINGQNDQGIQFSDQNKPLSFKVEKQEEDYLLQALNDFDFSLCIISGDLSREYSIL